MAIRTRVRNLAPADIAAADYSIATKPSIGIEKEVYISTGAYRVLGNLFFPADDSGSGTDGDWELENYPTDTDDPILCFVETKALANAPGLTVAWCGPTGDFRPVDYSRWKDNYNFGAGRGIELLGAENGEPPDYSDAEPVALNALAGTRITFVQVPQWSTFLHVGFTTSKDIELPIREPKFISKGFRSGGVVKPGMTTQGSLRITARETHDDEGLRRFAGMSVTALVQTVKEDRLIVMNQIFTDFVVPITNSNPADAGECELTGGGGYAYAISLLAGPLQTP